MTTSVGTLLACWNTWDATIDLRVVRNARPRDHALLIATKGELLDQQLIFLALACDAILGVLAMLSMQAKEPDGDPTIAALFGAWLIIIGAVALIYLSFIKKFRRRALMDALINHSR